MSFGLLEIDKISRMGDDITGTDQADMASG